MQRARISVVGHFAKLVQIDIKVGLESIQINSPQSKQNKLKTFYWRCSNETGTVQALLCRALFRYVQKNGCTLPGRETLAYHTGKTIGEMWQPSMPVTVMIQLVFRYTKI
ncbi:MAG: hypothetical protein EZS28_046257 [Streblomastix strix]|uniref:Uncharacterized protein n=1 Tax=Streblomastix strix TaxID=222440 RepID=A0A5J4TL14_9EUKA|nr:MAG: hypothetical protein EZS28_046257 [Streblomastix strix]